MLYSSGPLYLYSRLLVHKYLIAYNVCAINLKSCSLITLARVITPKNKIVLFERQLRWATVVLH